MERVRRANQMDVQRNRLSYQLSRYLERWAGNDFRRLNQQHSSAFDYRRFWNRHLYNFRSNMNLILSQPQSSQFVATLSQSISGGSSANISVPISSFASMATAWVVATSTLGGATAGYPGLTCILRPASATGRTGSVMVGSYPAAFESSLIAQNSDPIFAGCRLADCWIDNANSSVVFRFTNPTGGTIVCTARVTGVIFP